MKLSEHLRFLYRTWKYRLRVEPAEISFVVGNLRSGQTAIDIGAHKGAFTYWMSRSVGPAGRVIAFEPQPELSGYLEGVRRGLPLNNVTVVPAGVSSSSGSLRMHRPADEPSPSATLAVQEDSNTASSMDVSVHSLDEYSDAENLPRIDLIKCDVEGHELEVFRGATNVLRRDRPTLLFECEERHQSSSNMEEVFDFLEQIGYGGKCFSNGKLVAIEPDRLREQDPSSASYVNNFAFTHKRAA